ncbi:MAG: hypothetical protein P4L39_03860 [Humidesulfovibrio sp.]|nr:hypothetical protein [Humidesulfovibrio sp.]
MRRTCLFPFALALALLLLPARARAADPMQDAINQKQELDQSQREALVHAVSNAVNNPGKAVRAAGGEDKPFPGPAQTNTQQEAAPSPDGKAAPARKSGKAIYGDIIIYK